MMITEFFADRLRAPLRNPRWSWGAVSLSGDVYLRVWDDHFRTVKGSRRVRIWDPDDRYDDRGYKNPGAFERLEHVDRIRGGARVLCVLATPKDPSHREIESFDETRLMIGGELIEAAGGNLWLEEAGWRPTSAIDMRPRLVRSSRRPPEPPPVSRELQGRAPTKPAPDRRLPDPGRFSREPQVREPTGVPPRERLADPRPASRSAPTGASGPREVFRLRVPPERPPERRSRPDAGGTAGAPAEAPLESLHRAIGAPQQVFADRESRQDGTRERHRARETALQLLYQWDVGRIGAGDLPVALDLFWTVHPAPQPRRKMALGLARGTVGALPEIDRLIDEHTANWRSERLAVVDRLIMRLAVYELRFEKTPPAVVINEALVLAKTFSGEGAVSFVNGVLDAVKRTVLAGGRVALEAAAPAPVPAAAEEA